MHIVSDAERAVNEACTGFWFRLEDAQALFGADELQYDPVRVHDELVLPKLNSMGIVNQLLAMYLTGSLRRFLISERERPRQPMGPEPDDHQQLCTGPWGSTISLRSNSPGGGGFHPRSTRIVHPHIPWMELGAGVDDVGESQAVRLDTNVSRKSPGS